MKPLVIAALAALGLICTQGCRTVPHQEKEEVTLRLPEGSIERGEATFVALKCHACHTITRADVPAPYANPPVPIMLGAERAQPTLQQLVDSIITPSHDFEPGWGEGETKSGDLSRMGSYNDVLTVQQLSDLVAFLRSVYDY